MIYFALLTRKRDLIRLRNRSKLIQGSLYAIIDLLQGAKSILLYFIWRVGGIIFKKKIQILEKKIFILFYLIFLIVITIP